MILPEKMVICRNMIRLSVPCMINFFFFDE